MYGRTPNLEPSTPLLSTKLSTNGHIQMTVLPPPSFFDPQAVALERFIEMAELEVILRKRVQRRDGAIAAITGLSFFSFMLYEAIINGMQGENLGDKAGDSWNDFAKACPSNYETYDGEFGKVADCINMATATDICRSLCSIAEDASAKMGAARNKTMGFISGGVPGFFVGMHGLFKAVNPSGDKRLKECRSELIQAARNSLHGDYDPNDKATLVEALNKAKTKLEELTADKEKTNGASLRV